MHRFVLAAVAGGLLMAGSARADGPSGAWKITLPGGQLTFLLKLEDKDGKWSGSVLGTSIPNFPKVALADVVASADTLRFSLRFQGQEITFDGKLPADAKTGKIAGSLQVRPGQVLLLHLEPSKLKAFDKYEFARETIDQSTDSQALADSAIELLKQAGDKKVKIEQVRGWADKAFKAADAYGLRWQRSVATRLAQAAAPQKDFAPVAVEYARKAERLLDDSDDPAVQMEVLEAIVGVVTQAGKADDAKPLVERLTRLEEKDFAEYLKKAPFKPEMFDGRKSKSDRAVLVELFTGAECPPCVAADAGFDGLEKTYKPTEVILLQYHLHIPGPDPLTNPDTMARMAYYGRKIEGTPTIFFNGKPGASGGGPLQAARKKYAEFREVIEPLLEKNADAKLDVSATNKGGIITIKANVTDAARTGDGIRLRFVLVEDHVRYQGGNGLRYHHCVVRAMPGGAKGVPVAKKGMEHSASVNLDELRLKLTEYLDEYGKEEEFPKPDRPLGLKKLRVVALVQDDESNEILQAVQVDVK